MHNEKITTILSFWFGNLTNGLTAPEQQKLWWSKNSEIDQHIREQFQSDVLAAIAGKYETWLQKPKGTLTLIILVDQFCRHIYRDTPAAFAADPIALQWAKQGIDLQQDKQLSLIERVFFYMPFEHSEDLTAQQQSVALFYGLLKQTPPAQRQAYQDFYEYAEKHKAIIERFSRFPHRNNILQRPSTAAEKKFLTEPRASF